MNEFLTWTTLGTYAGAVLATTLVTQLLKGLSFIDKLPTRIFSYIVAVALLVLANVFSGDVSLSGIVLCFVNGVVVSLASNGAFEAVDAVRE